MQHQYLRSNATKNILTTYCGKTNVLSEYSDELRRLILSKNNLNIAPNNCLLQLAKKHGGAENYIRIIEKNSRNIGINEGVIIGVFSTIIVIGITAVVSYFGHKKHIQCKEERIAAEIAKTEIIRIVDEATIDQENAELERMTEISD